MTPRHDRNEHFLPHLVPPTHTHMHTLTHKCTHAHTHMHTHTCAHNLFILFKRHCTRPHTKSHTKGHMPQKIKKTINYGYLDRSIRLSCERSFFFLITLHFRVSRGIIHVYKWIPESHDLCLLLTVFVRLPDLLYHPPPLPQSASILVSVLCFLLFKCRGRVQ